MVAFGVMPLFRPLAITAFGGPEGCFGLAIIAFGAFEFILPKYHYRLGKTESKSLDSFMRIQPPPKVKPQIVLAKAF